MPSLSHGTCQFFFSKTLTNNKYGNLPLTRYEQTDYFVTTEGFLNCRWRFYCSAAHVKVLLALLPSALHLDNARSAVSGGF